MKRFAGKVALVTGGTSGIGLAAARRFHDEQATVIITGRNQDKLDNAARLLSGGDSASDRFLALQADTADLNAIDAAIHRIDERFGRLDIVFANAGVGGFNSVEDIDEADFDTVVDINFKGLFFTIQKALPLMREGGAVVINASWTLYRGIAISSLYSATKAAVHNLARTMAADLAARRIRVNSISPGYVNTELFNEGMLGPDEAARCRQEVALKRFAEPPEIAAVVAFLASDDASYITGQDLLVDGGLVTIVSR